ncbi:hypothetical protein PsAD2_03208 [Pseudovibrio axinellae]|uniref:Uncharacterized protein n=1 Tax=Pseudovibrio axinellae TaxID=989403 RepID=A0A165X070_9HYPH|nr:hypothetical protein PsAD2_03208 [Pseudovibrio axinellae]
MGLHLCQKSVISRTGLHRAGCAAILLQSDIVADHLFPGAIAVLIGAGHHLKPVIAGGNRTGAAQRLISILGSAHRGLTAIGMQRGCADRRNIGGQIPIKINGVLHDQTIGTAAGYALSRHRTITGIVDFCEGNRAVSMFLPYRNTIGRAIAVKVRCYRRLAPVGGFHNKGL